MKICLINNLYKPYNRGGAERIVELIEEELKNSGNDVFGITTRPVGRNKSGDELNNFYYLNSSYLKLNKIPKIFRLFWHLSQFFNISKVFKIYFILNKEKPDIILSHNMMGLSFLSFFIFKKYRHIHFLHDIQLLHPSGLIYFGQEQKVNSFFSTCYQFIQKIYTSSFKTVISPSKWLMDAHKEKGFFKNAKTIIQMNPFSCSDNSEENLKKEFDFLFVGQIEQHKGIEELIICFNEIKANNSLAIVGSGSLLEILKNKYSSPKITFMGRRTNSDLREIMKKSKCLVYPSLCYENSPTAIYEATSLSLPTLSSSLGGSTELIDEFGGFLFDYNIKGDLKNKLEFILQNPEELNIVSQKLQKKARKLRAQKYIDSILN